MINLTKVFLNWLKNIFKGESMNFEFADIDVVDVEKKIDLEKRAETDGRNNIPSGNSKLIRSPLNMVFNQLIILVINLIIFSP